MRNAMLQKTRLIDTSAMITIWSQGWTLLFVIRPNKSGVGLLGGEVAPVPRS
jgi:hypothetical protein